MNGRQWLAVLALAALGMAACVPANRYDGLTALTAGEVQPVPMAGAERPRLAIAFGGGGVRGFMHLGVIKAMEEEGLRADLVTGTSAGAVAAAMYASGMPYHRIEELAMSVSRYELLDLVVSRRGLVRGRALAEWITKATACRRLEDLSTPLGVAVTDLTSGRALLVVGGDLGGAVQASSSVPGTVVPVAMGNSTLVDGGVLTVLPVRFARAMGADVVVGVDIYCANYPVPPDHAVGTMFAAFRLQGCALADADASAAEVLVRPAFEPDSPASFAQRSLAIEAGYAAMKAAMPDIRKALARQAATAARRAAATANTQ